MPKEVLTTLKRQILVLVLLFANLWIFDTVLTTWGIYRYPQKFSEANPYLLALMERIGLIPALYLIKAGHLIVLFALAWWICARRPEVMMTLNRGLIFANFVMVVVLGTWGYGFACK